MTIQLERDEYTKKWVLPGEVWKRGGNWRKGVVRVNVCYDVHDPMGFRIWRAWKDNIIGYDNTPLRRPTKCFREIEAYWHPNTYGSADTRYGCRQFLANWLAGDCGIEVDVMRAIMDQIPFVPETYMKFVIDNHTRLLGDAYNKRNPMDLVFPPYIKRTVPSPIDALRASIVP